jgi:hypothetical protein
MTSPAVDLGVDVDQAEIMYVDYQRWQADVLTEALHADPGYRFFFGPRFTTANVHRFFEFYLAGLVEGGGSLVTLRTRTGDPYRGAIFGWRRFGGEFPPNAYDGMMDALGVQGRRRYEWFRKQSEVPLSTFGIEPGDQHMAVRLNIGGLRGDVQNRGIGTRISQLSLEDYESRGYRAPYVVSSTPAGQRWIARCGYARVEGRDIYTSAYWGQGEPEGLMSIISYRTKGLSWPGK